MKSTGHIFPTENSVSLSKIDEERFGHKTAKAFHLTPDGIEKTLEYCHSNKVKLLISRCETSNLKAAQLMEKKGFFLMDTLLYFQRELPFYGFFLSNPTEIRPFRINETSNIVEISRRAFAGYLGHYHADPRLEVAQCDEVYVSWAKNSCSDKNMADEILVAEGKNGFVVGFLTLKMFKGDIGRVLLNGVDPNMQGTGIYSSLVHESLRWGSRMGLKKMICSTQIWNLAVQRVWMKFGGKLFRSEYTFHKWF